MCAGDPQALQSHAPWLERQDWRDGLVRGRSGNQAALLWVMAVLWNAFIWAVVWLVWDDPERTAMLKVSALFAVLGLVLLGSAFFKTLAWLRFGSSVLELATTPAVIGGALDGRIRTRLRRPPAGPVQLTLSCIRRRESRRDLGGGSTRSRSRHDVRTDLLWQSSRLVPPERLHRDGGGLVIPVAMLVPFGLAPTDASDPDDQVAWTLSASADIPGVDFSAEFAVPVFVTEGSDPELTMERVDALSEGERQTTFAHAVDQGTSWAPPVVTQPTGGGGVRYTFRLAVTLKVALMVTGLGLAVCAGSAALFLWLGKAGPFALLPGAFGALLLVAAVVIWTFVSRVLVEGGSITVRKSVLGIPRTWVVPGGDVTKVLVRREDEDWGIRIQRRSGPVINLGATLPHRDDARRIAEEIERLLR